MLNNTEKAILCRWAGVNASDEAAVCVLMECYERAENWYRDAGCDAGDPGIKSWLRDLASWFYDNRGRSDAEIPPYIVKSVHHFRED